MKSKKSPVSCLTRVRQDAVNELDITSRKIVSSLEVARLFKVQ